MSVPLNILSIEDSNADFMMVERHLKQNGLSVRCHRVDSLAALKEAIDRKTWDLVLADYNVPQLDFQDSLRLLLAGLNHVPIIMVTGSLGEEKAVELLKLGVHDFVLKGSMVRLVPVIERSLKDAAEREARLATEHALQNSEVHFRSIFNRSPVAIGIGKVASGQVVDVNEAFLSLYGYDREEVVGRTTTELNLYASPDERIEIIRLISECGQVVSREVQVQRKTGEFLIVLYSAELINLSGESFLQVMLTDITERKKLEEQIRQAQKMEAVGQLAGGVAHDFNNMLSAIFGYSHLILSLLKDNEPVTKYVEEIMKASKRAAALTQNLLAFSRKQAVSLALIDLSQIIHGNELFLRTLIRENIELKIHCTGEPLTVLADRGQIEQVIMNLVANARDAMPNGGKLLIETRCVNMDQEFIETHGYGRAGAYAFLSVSDSGVGMDKAMQSHVFEPFFTTKEQGKGTGLGLSISYGIVKKHDGFISVCSEPGNGTVFTFYLPLVQATAQAGSMESNDAAPLCGGGETILVCEDDAALLRLSTKMLNRYGYCVVEAVNGQDAVDKFIEYGDRIHLVILDEIMPKKSGRDAYKEMRLVRPDLKAIFVSGYALDIAADGCVLDGSSVFIQKPVSIDELLGNVREMLDGKTAISPAQSTNCLEL